MKYLFIYPPSFKPVIAPLEGIPSLLGVLESEGCETEYIDLNSEFISRLKGNDFVNKLVTQYKNLLSSKEEDFAQSPLIQKTFKEQLGEMRNKFFNFYKLSKQIGFNLFVLQKNITYYNSNLSFYAIKSIYEFLDFFITFNSAYLKQFMPCFDNYSSGSMEQHFNIEIPALKEFFSSDFNILKGFYADYVDDILNKNPDFIGITVSTGEQILPALYLCYLLRQKTNVHINIGGGFFGAYYKNIDNMKEIFTEFFNSISLSNDSIPTVKGLIKYFDNKCQMSEISNFVYFENGEIKENLFAEKYDFANLPMRSFSGYKRQHYLAPEFVLPVRTSTGCYWHKCIFCECTSKTSRVYVKPVEKVVDEIEYLSKKYKTNYFYFWDNCIHPKYLEKMTDLLIKKRLHITYSIYARLDDGFDLKLLKKLKKSGCVIIHWGVDSASERMIEYINKGINIKTAEDILKNSYKAGIYNFIYFLLDLPSQTIEDLEANVAFIQRNKRHINMLNSITTLVALEGCTIFENYDKYEKDLNSIPFDTLEEYSKKMSHELWSDSEMEYLRYGAFNILYAAKYGNKKSHTKPNDKFMYKHKQAFILYMKYLRFIFSLEKKFKH